MTLERIGKKIITDTPELSFADLNKALSLHTDLQAEYQSLYDLYIGQHRILKQTNKAFGPDNRLVANMAHYIVDTFNGYFSGIPVKVMDDDEDTNTLVSTWNSSNSLIDKISELSKQVDIYGHSFMLVYQNEEAETKVAVSSPIESLIIYDDSIESRPVAFIRYSRKQSKLTGTLYTATEIKPFDTNGFFDIQNNLYGKVPAVEFYANEERQGILENVTTLINALDKTLSQKSNQVEYFDNAYLKVLGLNLDANGDGLPDINLNGNQMIYSSDPEASEATIDFIQKPDGDNMQEHLIDRLTDLIYQISMVANLNDQAFSGNSSGVALQYKLLPMKNMAANKERKFTYALRNLYRVVFSAGTVLPESKSDAWQTLKFRFTRNLPINLSDEAQTASVLQNVTSKETALSALSIVDDPKAEIDRIQDEQAEQIKSNISAVGAMPDYLKGDSNGKEEE